MLVLGAALGALWIGLPLVLAVVTVCNRLAELERRQANRLLDAHIPPLPAPVQHDGHAVAPRARLADRPRGLARARVRGDQAAAVRGRARRGAGARRGDGVAAHLRRPRHRRPRRPPLRRAVDARPAHGVAAVRARGCGGHPRHRRARGPAIVAGRRWRGRCSLRPSRRPAPSARCSPRASATARCRSRTGCPSASSSSTRRATSSACPSPARVAPGPPSSATAAASRRSSTTPSSPRARSSSTPRPRGAALAIDNERLKANLRARVEELRVSRVRIVEAQDHARRRIERDLHDGAQQQLVSLSLDLRLLKSKLNGNEAAAETVDALSEKLATALAELRELARGIHPVDPHRARARARRRGARPAGARAGRGEHLDPRPAHARDRVRRLLRGRRGAHQRRQVRAGRERRSSTSAARATRSTVLVEDDGVGGADIETGTGLRGLVDRLSALDGTLERRDARGRRHAADRAHPVHRRDLVSEATPDDDAQPTLDGGQADEALHAARRRAARARARRDGLRQGHRGPRARRLRRARASSPRPPPTGARRTASGRIRIAVVTHGAAASAFWAIVKNGVDAAARQMERLRLLPLARHLQRRAHEASSSTRRSTRGPTGSSSRSRTRRSRPRSAAPCAPASRSSRSTRARTQWRSLGVLAHVGQREEPAGYARRQAHGGRRASSARCASSRSCATARSTSAAPASRAAMREGGGTARNFALDVKDRERRRGQAAPPRSRRGGPTAS